MLTLWGNHQGRTLLTKSSWVHNTTTESFKYDLDSSASSETGGFPGTKTTVSTHEDRENDAERFPEYDISKCVNEVTFNISSEQGILTFNTDKNRTEVTEETVCSWLMAVPETYFLHFTFIRFYLPCGVAKLYVYNEKWEDCLDAVFCTSDKKMDANLQPHDYLSSDNAVYVQLRIFNLLTDAGFTMRFTRSSDKSHTEFGLQYFVTTPANTSGFLTTPGYAQRPKTTNCFDTWFSLSTPAADLSVVMISIWQLVLDEKPCKGKLVKIFREQEGPKGPQLLVEHSTDTFKRIHVLDAPLMFQYVCLDCYRRDTYRVKIVFSFHSASQPRPPTPDEQGLVNCSAWNFPSFSVHLRCDMIAQCLAGEDEYDCPHTSPACDGHLLFNSTCYAYIPPQIVKREGGWGRWNLTHNPCTLAGQAVAGVSTAREFHALKAILARNTVYKWALVDGKMTSSRLRPLFYKHVLQNGDGSMNYFTDVTFTGKDCLFILPGLSDGVIFNDCTTINRDAVFICEFSPHSSQDDVSQESLGQSGKPLQLPVLPPLAFSLRGRLESASDPDDGSLDAITVISLVSYRFGNVSSTSTVSARGETTSMLRRCARGFLVFDFLSCDVGSDYEASSVPPFTCDSGEALPYSLLCDFYADCPDSSDESFCVRPPCGAMSMCGTWNQCVIGEFWCDDRQHCRDRSDENDCGFVFREEDVETHPVHPPAVVNFDGYGRFTKTALKANAPCPDTRVPCPGSYCLPIFVVCNGVYDCPGREDEARCDTYTCPGFYRCRRSSVCLHPQYLCDSVFHCPYHDDEVACGFRCPPECLCEGLSAMCSQTLYVHRDTQLRYVDASGTGMSLDAFQSNSFIVFLRLAKCQLKSVGVLLMPNLQTLDLSYNLLGFLRTSSFVELKNLKKLSLSGNPISRVEWSKTTAIQRTLRIVDLSSSQIHVFVSRPFQLFRGMAVLNLSASPINSISEDGLQFIPNLEVFDIRGTKLEFFQGDVFLGLTRLSQIYADNYKLCCRATLPKEFPPDNCHAPADEMSSCEDLLPSDLYRVCLWVFAVMATVGNIGSVVFKVWFQKDGSGSGFNVFVIQLSVSDLCMGVYLVIIGIVDLSYRGQYLWHDAAWKHSSLCRAAGFLSLLSAEVSAFIIFLITMDRFIVFRFPFSDVRFNGTSALVACGITWLLGALLAGVPLLPMTSHWGYYSQTGICIPLPVTRKDFAGRTYSFAVMIVLNLAVFLLIAVGQVSIYWSIYSNSMDAAGSSESSVGRKTRDAAIVRRLSAVVVSDFLCWFPIGILGLLSSVGTPIPGWLNVVVAILVLPINSAVNPFLYTYNMLMETRRRVRKAQQQRLLAKILRNFQQRQQQQHHARKTEPAPAPPSTR